MPVDTLIEAESRIEETVEREVRLRTNGRIRGLQVRVFDGQVVISGRASTYYAKQLATRAALDTAGDLSVANDVEVS